VQRERELTIWDRIHVLGVGWDSAAALLVYLGGMTVLYFLQ